MKRLAALVLAYALLAGLIAPGGLVAQEEQPGGEPQQTQTTTTAEPEQPAAPPTETQPQPAPPEPAQQQAATTAQPAPAPPPPAAPAPAKPVRRAPVAVSAGAGSVTMKNIAFSPATVTVNVGDTVSWNNADEVVHNATADDGSFATGSIKPGASGSHTFAKAGSFAYNCTIHPGMDGTVKVVAASSGGGNQGSSSGGGQSGGGSSSPGTTSTSGSSNNLPATGIDAGALAVWGLGLLLIGLFARRRTTT
jgi:LPXTG-motif cell wall-anchored protein